MMVVEAIDYPAINATNSNVQSVSDFWMFVVYCLVVIVVVLFFLFYFNRALGQILTWLINQYTWRRYKAYLEVESVRVTLLGARILFKNLRYRSTNQSISIVRGHISLQYWLYNVRKTSIEEPDANKGSLPCRIVINLKGLEWFIYNNVPAYENLMKILGLASGDVSSSASSVNGVSLQSTQDTESQTATTNINDSFIHRLMPIQLECTKGALMIGNNELRSMIVCQTVQATGIWSAEESRSNMDHYKSTLELALRKLQINLKDNMDFEQPSPDEASGTHPMHSSARWQRMLHWIMHPVRTLFHPATRTRQFGHMQHMHDIMNSQHTRLDGERTTSHLTTFHEEYARVDEILKCTQMVITYYADVPGPVPSTAPLVSSGVGRNVGNGGLPPEWGVQVFLWNATMHYGPWTDRQRTAIQGFFYPNPHRNGKPTPILEPGEQRIATAFEFYVESMTDITLRIPTKERSKDWRYETESAELDIDSDGNYTRPYGWIDIKAAAGSTVKTVTPFVNGVDGSTSSIEVHLKEIDASTSVNYASLIQAKTLDLSVLMPSPLVWNAHREWHIDVSIKTPHIFLLRDHVFLFQDLIKDWTSTLPPDLLHFVPITYTFNATITEPHIYLCVNEHNIISNPNALDDNAYIKVHSSKVHFNMSLPFTDYNPEVNTIQFNAEMDQFQVGISLQASHTLNAFMEEEDARFGVSVHVSIDGSYEYYTSVDILRHIEMLNLDIKLNGVTCKLFGTVIRYLMILRDNYVGSWINFCTIDEYRQRQRNKQEWQAMRKKQADSKPIQDPFEVYILVDVQDGSLLLPENLYDCSHYSQMDFQELQVELRNLDIYMDMYINVSPITWTRRSYVDSSPNKAFVRSRNVRDEGNFLYIDELNIYAHRLFGPLPDIATYLCHWEFEVGTITGEVKPSFLLGTACFAQTFVYDMIDEDNAVPAEIAPAADPDVTFVKASVKHVDVYLMSEHSAANVNLESGLTVDFDNLVNEAYNQRIAVKVPALIVRALANQEQQAHIASQTEFSWVEVAMLSTGMNITVFRHTKDWEQLRKAQQNFIRAQDLPTRRCTHLYEEDAKRAVQENVPNNHHVGVLYAPVYKSFRQGTVNYAEVIQHTNRASPDKALQMTSCYARERIAAEQSFHSLAAASDIPSLRSYVGDWGQLSGETTPVERRSFTSGFSGDSESFHTAYSNEDAVAQGTMTAREWRLSADTDESYSGGSVSNTESDENVSPEEQVASSRQLPKDKAPEATLPPSIQYSKYLNRYSVKAASPSTSRSLGFFHPYLPPPKTQFKPMKDNKRRNYSSSIAFDNESRQKNGGFLFPESDELLRNDPEVDEAINEDKSEIGAGNDVVVTTVLEATNPVNVLMTPILVKIVQEVTESINGHDWDLETMLDSMQMEYVGQLTRYLTDQFVCTRFAVSLPYTHFHFIQNVLLPDDLPSYKDGIKTKYDPDDTMLCSADVFLNDFSMIGSVKFQDLAYDEKKRSVAESKLVLKESRVHIDLGALHCKVQYVSERSANRQQPMVFGIPKVRQHEYPVSMEDEDINDDNNNKLVVIDFELRKFRFRWLGKNYPNYFSLEIDTISTIIITEAVEILVGAVYSWLVFVDDLEAILESFQEQRTRQFQLLIYEIANYSKRPTTQGDPPFLTKPSNVLRLGSSNFRRDVGWKLLARMRYCLRVMDTGTRVALQYKLSKDAVFNAPDPKDMYDSAVEAFSHWRSWEISVAAIATCRLLTQPFNQQTSTLHNGDTNSNIGPVDQLVALLMTSANVAKVNIATFDFCIYEEEQEMDDNSITIEPVDVLLSSDYKRSVVSFQDDTRRSGEGETDRRKHDSTSPQDGYLDVNAKAVVGAIRITVNPTILAFARHMLTVQRVFAAKLANLSHATKTNTSSSPLPNASKNEELLDLRALITKIDIVAQALMNIKEFDICARAQKLTMQTVLREIQGSVLFSNPKLTPLPFFPSSERGDSDTGSGVRSSTKASRRTAGNRLIFEAAGGIEYIDIRFYEIIAQNHPVIRELLVITLDGVNVNANISQPTRSGRKQSRTEGSGSAGREVLNIFSDIHKFNVHAPQSLLRLYGFVADWRSEQGQRYAFLFKNLMNEWEEQRKTAMDTSVPESKDAGKKYDIKLQFLLNRFVILSDLLPSLSAEYNIDDFFIIVHETHLKPIPVQKYVIQLSRQELHLIPKNNNQSSNREAYAGGSFSIPGIRSTGCLRNETRNGISYLELQSMVFVDFISLSLNVGMIDSLLTAQSLVGNEINDVIEVLSYDKEKRRKDTALMTSTPVRKFRYSVNVCLNGLRISAVSPTALGVFESNLLEATLKEAADNTSDNRLSWKIKARDFALSLEHNLGVHVKEGQRNRLAYIIADFEVQNYMTPQHLAVHEETHLEPFHVVVSRIHIVMQPIALGKLADMYIYYDSELKKKKEMKKTELERLTMNTRRLVESFKRDVPRYQDATHAIWEGKYLSFTMQRLGIAVPLDASDSRPHHIQKETSALLLSIAYIHFLSKNIEKSAAMLEDISLQFVKKFDQNNDDHFSAETHPKMNRMYLPSITCQVHTRSQRPKQIIKIDANVGGFEVDIDGAFSDHLNALNVIYVRSKDRVDAFTHINKEAGNQTHNENAEERSSSELVYLDIEGMFRYQSGVVRMYPKRHSGEGSRKKTRTINDGADIKIATLKIPGLTAWTTYQTSLGDTTADSDAPRRLHGDIMIHESENILHPSLVQFLREIVSGLQFGMQQSSERNAVRTTTTSLESNINVSLVLRLMRTRLDLSCQPASKVMCYLIWDQGEFTMNSFKTDIASHTMSCVGTIRNLSATVKHPFSPEACLTATIEQILFNAMLSSQRLNNKVNDDISIVVKVPSIVGDINIRHLQDLFILNSLWLEQTVSDASTPTMRKPVDRSQDSVAVTEESTEATPLRPFARYIAVHAGTIRLSVDLGQAIGVMMLVPENLNLNTYNVPEKGKGLNISLDRIDLTSEGRLSGTAQFGRIYLQSSINVGRSVNIHTLSLTLALDGFLAKFDYEYQHILDMVQEPIELVARLGPTPDDVTAYELAMSMTIKSTIASVSIKTVPVIITMYKKFTEMLDKKKAEAGMLNAPAPASDSVSCFQKQSQHANIRLLTSSVDISLESIEIIIYPSQFQDADNVELYGKQLQLTLQQRTDMNQGSVNRSLKMLLENAALLKSVQGAQLMMKRSVSRNKTAEAITTAAATSGSSHSTTAGSTPGSPTAQPRVKNTGKHSNGGSSTAPANSISGISIFGIPRTLIQMESTQLDKYVDHTFTADFGGRINVSLNLGLIRYLQELANMFTSQLDRALQNDQPRRTSMASIIDDRSQSQAQQDDDSLDSGVAVRQAISISRKTSKRSLSEDAGDVRETIEETSTLIYRTNAPVSFHPQLQIMGDATPPVEWLGLRRERIPGLVHENVTLQLDQLVQAIWDMYADQTQTQQ